MSVGFSYLILVPMMVFIYATTYMHNPDGTPKGRELAQKAIFLSFFIMVFFMILFSNFMVMLVSTEWVYSMIEAIKGN